MPPRLAAVDAPGPVAGLVAPKTALETKKAVRPAQGQDAQAEAHGQAGLPAGRWGQWQAGEEAPPRWEGGPQKEQEAEHCGS